MSTKSTLQMVLDLAAITDPEASYRVEQCCSLLTRHARTHHHLCELDCNGFQDWQGNWDEAASNRNEKRMEQLERRMTEIVAAIPLRGAHKLRVEFQGDPRGATVKLTGPKATISQVRNTGWEHDKYPVPFERGR